MQFKTKNILICLIALAGITYLSNSFLPLSERAKQNYTAIYNDLKRQSDTVSWDLLEETKTIIKVTPQGQLVTASYPPQIIALKNKHVCFKGFMVPLEITPKQSKFILSPSIPSCPFCMPVGPNQLVVVEPKNPIKTTDEKIIFCGKLILLSSNQDLSKNVFYSLVDSSIF